MVFPERLDRRRGRRRMGTREGSVLFSYSIVSIYKKFQEINIFFSIKMLYI